MKISKSLNNSIIDYKYLLEKEYSQKSILKIVGDRYMLSGCERTLLYRGITTKKKVIYRSNKKVYPNKIKNDILFIDGYNVLITISSYLKGSLVFIGNDKFLRDASEIHGKELKENYFNKSILLLLDYLKTIEVKEVYFIFDAPIKNSGKLCQEINNILAKKNILGIAKTSDSPDLILKRVKFGLCATSDSEIIDKCQVKIFDLAFYVIKHHFNPVFLKLHNYF